MNVSMATVVTHSHPLIHKYISLTWLFRFFTRTFCLFALAHSSPPPPMHPISILSSYYSVIDYELMMIIELCWRSEEKNFHFNILCAMTHFRIILNQCQPKLPAHKSKSYSRAVIIEEQKRKKTESKHGHMGCCLQFNK